MRLRDSQNPDHSPFRSDEDHIAVLHTAMTLKRAFHSFKNDSVQHQETSVN